MSFIWRWRSSDSGKLRSGLFQAKCYPHLTDLMQLFPCFSYFPLQRSAREVKINQSMEWTVCMAWIYYFYMEFFRSVYLFFSIVFFSHFYVCYAFIYTKEGPTTFRFLILVIDFCLNLFQTPWSFSAKTNPEVSVQVGMWDLVLFEVQARQQNRFYHCRYYAGMIIAVLCGKVSNKSSGFAISWKGLLMGLSSEGCFNELSDYGTEFLRFRNVWVHFGKGCYILKFLNCIVITAQKNFSRLLNSSIIITLKEKPGTTAYKICLYNRAWKVQRLFFYLLSRRF